MAKPVLDKDIYSFPLHLKPGVGNPLSQHVCSRNQSSSNFITTTSGFSERVTSKDILSYFLLGGMIYTGLRDWARAIHFYEIAIVAPATNAVSKVQVEAYNKRLLVGLLWKGIVSSSSPGACFFATAFDFVGLALGSTKDHDCNSCQSLSSNLQTV